MSVRLTKGKIFGTFFGVMFLAIYPIAIYPYFNIDAYKEVQKVSRKGIKQEEIQPGNMNVWKDPFGRK